LKCPLCEAENPDGVKYCNECGGKIAPERKLCPDCGRSSMASGPYCTFCGASFEREERTEEPRPAQTTFYAPPSSTPTVVHVEPSKHMSVGGFLVIVLIIVILFVVFLLFFARSTTLGQICGIAVPAPLFLTGALVWIMKRLRRQ